MAPGRAQLRVGQIGVRCLGKSTVAKRGKGEIVAQLGGSPADSRVRLSP